jgi:hypothetical protein
MTAQNSAGALGAPQPTRAHPSGTDKASVAEAQHSEPTVTLYGRIAAGPIGYVSWPDPPDLHFQTPGWENPIPGHFFKGEVIR